MDAPEDEDLENKNFEGRSLMSRTSRTSRTMSARSKGLKDRVQYTENQVIDDLNKVLDVRNLANN